MYVYFDTSILYKICNHVFIFDFNFKTIPPKVFFVRVPIFQALFPSSLTAEKNKLECSSLERIFALV